MRRLNMHLLMVVLLLLLLAGCRSLPIGGHAIIDWVDFIKCNGKMYYGIHTGIVADEKFIGEKLGEVKFQVANHVTNPNYKIKDGDAAFHEKGTEIYRIKGKPDLLAVKDTSSINGYRIYYERDKFEYRWDFKNVPLEKVNAIEIYQGYAPNTKKITKIKDKDKVNHFLKILKNSEEKPDFQPVTTKGDPTYYEMVLYIDEPIAYKYSIQFDGTSYFWYPWEPSILSKEIGAFIPN